MKKASLVLVGLMAIGIVYLSIALVTARTELRVAKTQLAQVSAQAEIWESAFKGFYKSAKADWRMARAYATLNLGGASFRAIARQLGLETPEERFPVFQGELTRASELLED